MLLQHPPASYLLISDFSLSWSRSRWLSVSCFCRLLSSALLSSPLLVIVLVTVGVYSAKILRWSRGGRAAGHFSWVKRDGSAPPRLGVLCFPRPKTTILGPRIHGWALGAMDRSRRVTCGEMIDQTEQQRLRQYPRRTPAAAAADEAAVAEWCTGCFLKFSSFPYVALLGIVLVFNSCVLFLDVVFGLLSTELTFLHGKT